jgi:RNA polymerase sigma-70 factor (ECF subfamily)
VSEPDAHEQGAEKAKLFDSLFTSHHEAILRYCVRRLGPSEGEDAAADVFAVAWRRLDLIPSGDQARAWLIGAAYKVVGNRYRTRSRGNRLRERLRSESVAVTTGDAEKAVESIQLALEELSPADRELIRLAFWDGLSRSEISKVLGIRVNAIDQRLHRARRRLKSHLDRLVPTVTPTRTEEASL